MNTLAYLIYHSSGPATPIVWLVNVVIYLIVALILWLIIRTVAAEFGVSPNIIKMIGLLLFLVLILSLFVG